MREVVITGLGPVAPNGVGKEKYWDALRKGVSGIGRITRFDPSGYPCEIAGEVSLDMGPSPLKSGPAGSRNNELALAAAALAIEDAGLTLEELSACRSSGVCIGVSSTDIGVIQHEHTLLLEKRKMTSSAIVSCFPHAPSSLIAQAINCRGDVTTISTGCPSGLHSVIYAAEAIARGSSDIMITGGVDAPLSPLFFGSFCAAGVLPKRFNNDPQRASRPFDSARDGGVLAEGSGVVILEDSERAYRRGARVYARIPGWGSANASSLKDLKLSMYISMHKSLLQSGLRPTELDYICAHAPGDQLIDRIETEAIKELCGSQAYNIPVSSIKSMIGNPLAGAGPLQLIAVALAIQHSFIPPTINYENPDPRCDLDYVPCKGRAARVHTALINLHGFGGANAAMLVMKPDTRVERSV